MTAARRKLGRLTTRAWGLILGIVLVLPLLIGGLTDRHAAAIGAWPWRTGLRGSFVYIFASGWLVFPFVVGMWVLFMAIVVGRRRRLFLWSFIMLAWLYTLGQVGLVTMFRPEMGTEVSSLRALLVRQWTGGTWLGIFLVAAGAVVLAAFEQVLRRRDGRREVRTRAL